MSAVSVDRRRLIESGGVISHLHDQMDERVRREKRRTLLTQIEENTTRGDRVADPKTLMHMVWVVAVMSLSEAHGSDR